MLTTLQRTGILQPTGRPQLYRSHPLAKALDYVWIGGDLSGIDLARKLKAPPPSGTTRTSKFRGVALANTGTAGTTVAISGANIFPYVQIGVGYFLSSGNSWRLSNVLQNSGGGYQSGIRLYSSTQIEAQLQYNYGTARSLTLTPGGTISDGSQLLAAILVVYSSTDYRLFCKGLSASGSLSPGTLGSFDRVTPPCDTLNGGMLLQGYGFGRAISDDIAIALTKDPSRIWRIFRSGHRVYTLGAPAAAGGGVTLSPAAGAIAVTGNMPALTIPLALTSAAGVIPVTGNAPTLTIPLAITPATGAIVVTGNAPTLTIPLAITPATGAIVVTGNTPAVDFGGGITLTPSTGAIVVAGNTPALTIPLALAPASGAITVTGNTPAVDFGAGITLTPSAGAITVTGNTPALTIPLALIPSTGAITVTGNTPAVDTGAGGLPDPATLRRLSDLSVFFRLDDSAITVRVPDPARVLHVSGL